MIFRFLLALLVVAALAAVAGVLSMSDIVGDKSPSATTALGDNSDTPNPLVATPARPHASSVALPGVALTPVAVVALAAADVTCGRPRAVRALPARLGDVEIEAALEAVPAARRSKF